MGRLCTIYDKEASFAIKIYEKPCGVLLVGGSRYSVELVKVRTSWSKPYSYGREMKESTKKNKKKRVKEIVFLSFRRWRSQYRSS